MDTYREVKEELAKIETYRMKLAARNQTRLTAMQETANAQSLSHSENSALARSKLKLNEAKEQFLRELNLRDPTWA